jgi:Domain of Unknown Function (DUF1259)
MSNDVHLTRRGALAAGGGAVSALLLSRAPARGAASPHKQHGHLPAASIQSIVGIEGALSSGVLGMSPERKDIGTVRGPQGVHFPPSFELNGDLYFQPLGAGLAFFNGDIALKASELNRVIDAIDANGLVFQAMHQHYFDLDPMVWFIHFRGTGEPLALARAVRRVLDVTATPLPQTSPKHPTTPLKHATLARTLGGGSEIGDDGVVTISVNRSDRIVIGDVEVSPETNVSTNVEFLPLDHAGTRAAVAPDFSMRTPEVPRVCKAMRAAGFEIGCLYNQETGEHPQLYFAHMIATGDPYALAVKVRAALDLTRSERAS